MNSGLKGLKHPFTTGREFKPMTPNDGVYLVVIHGDVYISKEDHGSKLLLWDGGVLEMPHTQVCCVND